MATHDDDDDDEGPPGLPAGTPFYMTPAGHAALAELTLNGVAVSDSGSEALEHVSHALEYCASASRSRMTPQHHWEGRQMWPQR